MLEIDLSVNEITHDLFLDFNNISLNKGLIDLNLNFCLYK